MLSDSGERPGWILGLDDFPKTTGTGQTTGAAIKLVLNENQ